MQPDCASGNLVRKTDLKGFRNNRTQGMTSLPMSMLLLMMTLAAYAYGRSAGQTADIVTSSGRLRGRVEEFGRTKVRIFHGIPFAQPPVGNLRFKKPVAVEAVARVLEATTMPLLVDARLSTMVWIHGGAFMLGGIASIMYNPRNLVLYTNVIVVSIQYRLGPLGFLYLGSDDAPGSMGMLDQVLALEWVKQNIALFGGDPDSITLIGESSGSMSASFHLVSPLSRDLFNRAIMMSGSAMMPGGYHEPDDQKSRSVNLAKVVGCDHDDEAEMVACLMEVPANDLATAQLHPDVLVLDHALAFLLSFEPTIDGSFLKDAPENLLKNGEFKRASVMSGTVRDEGSWFMIFSLPTLVKLTDPTNVSVDLYESSIPKLLPTYSDGVHKVVAFTYTDWSYAPTSRSQSLIDMIGDYHFVCPAVKEASRYADEGENVYMYIFTHRSTNSKTPEWAGVMHGEDIPYIFGLPPDVSGFTMYDKEVSKHVMNYFSNFAKSGNPNKPSQVDERWLAYKVNEGTDGPKRYYKELSTKKNAWGRGPRLRECTLWNDVVPFLQQESESSGLGVTPTVITIVTAAMSTLALISV
ncbi:PREDICTED: LOW QUALITY PROTEIN: acetylcholinesterase-like [Priapulus caudatus]|uniref:Carboxylic ester hydrolase n=1 Tax=Priapulus caudatus TaxID=37621 RepID=A0ABM1DSW4_PRICU|nr:PREDICTED: LOW QUALITY PROTEIN: acetylcholinesterase-like [Priapulus caudatus]